MDNKQAEQKIYITTEPLNADEWELLGNIVHKALQSSVGRVDVLLYWRKERSHPDSKMGFRTLMAEARGLRFSVDFGQPKTPTFILHGPSEVLKDFGEMERAAP